MFIAALAIICIDNPMCAGTGYRICNNCSKACIFQKQTPVNIPLIETNILNNVLDISYGFEIYSLLTRWNPLKSYDYIPKALNQKKILIVGMGPAGYTLAHYLLNEGCTVIGIDGLKIEPLPTHLINKPIKDVKKELYENLDDRIIGGFGGVAEYGITVRWNKNYLKVIRLILEKRKNFRLYGGIRFGSNISYKDAFYNLQFDHVALATGAGKPKIPKIPNSLATGTMVSSDFLMSLHMSAAFKKDILATLSIRLPIIVIGGGLTAIDVATESLQYYAIQVEKFCTIYCSIINSKGKEYIDNLLNEEEMSIIAEYCKHYEIILQERNKAQLENREPQIIKSLQSLGGVTVIYYKDIKESACYRINPEEVEHALREGIFLTDCTDIKSINLDKFNSVESITALHAIDKREITIPTKTVIFAIGTSSNDIFFKECNIKYTNFLKGEFIEQNNCNKKNIQQNRNHFLTHKNKNGKSMSIFGDLHPYYKGSVVSAMASAKYGFKRIIQSIYKQNYLPIELNLKECNKYNSEIINQQEKKKFIY